MGGGRGRSPPPTVSPGTKHELSPSPIPATLVATIFSVPSPSPPQDAAQSTAPSSSSEAGERVTVPATLDGAVVPFERHLSTAPAGWDSFANFEMHEHYVWHSARPRPKQATVELRSACQQPHDSHMVAAALSVGMVEAAPQLLRYVLTGSPNEGAALEGEGMERWATQLKAQWPRLRKLHDEAMRSGLADDAVAAFSSDVLEICRGGLARRGLGEEGFLEPLFGRVARRQNPGQWAQGVLRQRGVGGLVGESRIRA